MRKTVTTSLILSSLLATAAVGSAQAPKGTSPAQTAQAEKKAPAIDANAIAALKKMGAFLREQKNFSVRIKTETDYVLDTEQKIRLSADGNLRVRRPDHVRADVMSDRKQRQFFYDGKTFTIFSPQTGYYATVAAPPTILRLAGLLQDRYGLELPMVDLFRWGTDDAGVEAITSATHVGTATIDGVATDHYAFRQPGLDWQIWIERGGRPVPRKMLLTTTDDKARPEHAIEMTWNLGVTSEDAVFAFVPPKDSTKIAMAETTAFRSQHARRARRSPNP